MSANVIRNLEQTPTPPARISAVPCLDRDSYGPRVMLVLTDKETGNHVSVALDSLALDGVFEMLLCAYHKAVELSEAACAPPPGGGS